MTSFSLHCDGVVLTCEPTKVLPMAQRFFGHWFLQVHDHNDAGLDRRAEQRGITNPDGHAAIDAHDVLEPHATGERKSFFTLILGEGHAQL